MNRSAFVSGATRGIGEAVLRQLVQRGVRVGCGYSKSAEKASALAEELSGSVTPIAYKLETPEDASHAVHSTISAYGQLDSLILNAGSWAGGRLRDLDPVAWEKVVSDSVFGAARLCRAALPALRSSEAGSITILSSVVGVIGGPGDTAYSSAKAGLIGFGKSLAKEVANHGIRVNIVAPGLVDTDMTASLPVKSREHIQKNIALKRPGSVEEIAGAVVFLSEDATYCTGTVLTVDGGWSI